MSHSRKVYETFTGLVCQLGLLRIFCWTCIFSVARKCMILFLIRSVECGFFLLLLNMALLLLCSIVTFFSVFFVHHSHNIMSHLNLFSFAALFFS